MTLCMPVLHPNQGDGALRAPNLQVLTFSEPGANARLLYGPGAAVMICEFLWCMWVEFKPSSPSNLKPFRLHLICLVGALCRDPSRDGAGFET